MAVSYFLYHLLQVLSHLDQSGSLHFAASVGTWHVVVVVVVDFLASGFPPPSVAALALPLPPFAFAFGLPPAFFDRLVLLPSTSEKS